MAIFFLPALRAEHFVFIFPRSSRSCGKSRTIFLLRVEYCVSVCVSVRVYVRTYACVVCLNLYVYAYVYVYVYVYMFACV